MARVRFLGVKAVGAVRIGDHANLADGETIVIGDKTYEWDDNATVTPGNVGVTIGADAAGDIVNLKAAINANKPSVPVSGEIDPKDTAVLRLTADAQGSAGNLAMSKTMADADNIISGAAMTGGENAGTQTVARGKYEVTALDILADNIVIDTALATPRFFQVDVRDTNGVEKAVTCKTSLSGSLLILDFDGATDPVATDEVFWDAWE